MKNTFRTGLYTRLADGRHTVLLYLDQEPNVDKLVALVESDEVKTVSIEVQKNKRSLTANGTLWMLLNQLAIKLKTTDEELYMDFLHKYGPRDFIAAPVEAEPILKRMYKIVEVVKECKINDTNAVTYRLIRGTSQHDSKEFSRVLDAVIDECKLQGIETPEDMKIKQLMEEYDEMRKM